MTKRWYAFKIALYSACWVASVAMLASGMATTIGPIVYMQVAVFPHLVWMNIGSYRRAPEDP